jgi:hypothetical protein
MTEVPGGSSAGAGVIWSCSSGADVGPPPQPALAQATTIHAAFARAIFRSRMASVGRIRCASDSRSLRPRSHDVRSTMVAPSDMHPTAFPRWAWLLICVACGGAASSSQPDASRDAAGDGGDASARDSATSDGASEDAACGSLSGCVSPNSCTCTGRVQVSAAQACQMLEERLQVNGYIASDTSGSACESACGSSDACYVSPDYVQQAAAANGSSTGPFDAGSFVCPPVSCAVTVACAPSSC